MVYKLQGTYVDVLFATKGLPQRAIGWVVGGQRIGCDPCFHLGHLRSVKQKLIILGWGWGRGGGALWGTKQWCFK